MRPRESTVRRLEDELGELLEEHDKTASLDSFGRYADDPVGFAEEVLGVELWSKQEEILLSVRDNTRTVVLGANSVGKDFANAVVALWAAYARGMLVLVTASADRTAGDVFMRRELHPRFQGGESLPGELYARELRIPGSQAGVKAMTSTSASKLTGMHHPGGVLAILTEAQDVPPFAWEAMEANATGEDDRILAVGNPLSPEGRFYQVADRDE